MKRYRCLLLWLVVGCLLLGILLSGTPSCTRQVGPAASIGSPEWRESLKRWLDVAYIEEEHSAAFGNVAADVLAPDLYTTYAAIQIMKLAGEDIEDLDGIIQWINSLQAQDGSYRDPGSSVPPAFQMYWAVEALSQLGAAPSNTEAVKSFLRSRQQPSGLFTFEGVSGIDSVEESLDSTYLALEILRAAGLWSSDVVREYDLDLAAGVANAFASAEISGRKGQQTEETSAYVGTALHIVAWVEPQLISDQAREWVQATLSNEVSSSVESVSAATTNDLLDLYETLQIQPAATSLVDLGDYVRNRVLPQMCPSGAVFAAPHALEPMMTLDMVKLAARTGVDYPNVKGLLYVLGTHRISEGWCRFYSFDMSSEATFYALALAKKTGVDGLFDKDKVGTYLTSVLDGTITSDNLGEVYFALRSRDLLGIEVTGPVREALVSQMQDWLQRPISAEGEEAADKINMGEAYILGLMAIQLGLGPEEVPPLPSNVFSDRLLAHPEAMDINGWYRLYVLEKCVAGDEPLPHQDAIIEAVSKLSTDNGGYVASADSLFPDLHSTYVAVTLLRDLGRADLIDEEATAGFVEDSRAQCGFGIAPQSLLTQYGANVDPDFLLTYEGLWLLDNCSP